MTACVENPFISITTRMVAAALAISGACLCSTSAVHANNIAAFYEGRTIEMLAGAPPASGYDNYARLVARHIGKFIPGNPAVLVKNMPAAAGLAQANYLYNQAPRDGSVIGILFNNMTVEPMFGNANARFEPENFSWIGSANKMVNVCVAWHTTLVRKIEDIRSKQWLVGGTAERSPSVQMAHTFMSLAGANFRVVKGYPGTMPMILALERRELDIACGIGWDAVRSSSANYLDSGKIVPVLQLGYQRHPELKDVTFIYDVLIDPTLKDALDFLTVRLHIGRAFAAPPGIPADRLQVLRDAFWKAINDPGLRAEAAKTLVEVIPSPGKDVQADVTRLISTPKHIVELANRAVENTLNSKPPPR